MVGKRYFSNLDSIRFVAATMVFLSHTVSHPLQTLPISSYVKNTIEVVCNGGTGVSIFFVLSGFLITYLLVSEYEAKAKIDLKKFYMRRILRIWPLYYSVLLFTFVIYPCLKSALNLNHPLSSNFLYHISFLSNFDVINIHNHFSGNDAASQNITWSVSVEEQFYLFWPLIFAVLPKKFWLYAVALVLGFSVWFRVVNSTNETILYFHTFSVLVDLAVGGIFAILVKHNINIRRYFESVGTVGNVVFFAVAIVLLFCDKYFYLLPYGIAFYRLLTAISFGFIITSQALTNQTSPLNLGRLKFASKYGKYTYGIYLLHPIVITLSVLSLRVLKINGNGVYQTVLMGIVCFIITLLVSKFSYEKFEVIFLKIKNKKFSAEPIVTSPVKAPSL